MRGCLLFRCCRGCGTGGFCLQGVERPRRSFRFRAVPRRSGIRRRAIVEPVADVPQAAAGERADSPRFIVEELLPYSQPESTAANRPLSLDDPEAVWWVSSGGVDVFFTQFEPGAHGGEQAAPVPG